MGNRYTCEQTFEEWCINNNRLDILNLWDYKKNGISPSQVASGTRTKYYFKCPNEIHESESRRLIDVTDKPNHNLTCLQCVGGAGGQTREDLQGKIFGDLKVLYFDEAKTREKKNTYWFCECSCGNIVSVLATKLKGGNKLTCGGKYRHIKPKSFDGIIDVFDPRYLKELRQSSEYYYYRKAVMEKDGYKCIICGSYDIEVHHIYPFALFPEYRLDLKTGICMCKEHHSVAIPDSFHSVYGRYDNTPEQLEEYINNKRKELGNYEHFDIYEYINNTKLENDLNLDLIQEENKQ